MVTYSISNLTFDILFSKLNTFRKGENGEECIKRAICETVQNERSDSNNCGKQKPDSFVKELLRAVFR